MCGFIDEASDSHLVGLQWSAPIAPCNLTNIHICANGQCLESGGSTIDTFREQAMVQKGPAIGVFLLDQHWIHIVKAFFI